MHTLTIFLRHQIHQAAQGRWFIWVCFSLAFLGTLSATYPITIVIISATLLTPLMWRRIALFTALASACAATLLVLVFHDLGWAQVYIYFPKLAHDSRWLLMMEWTARYGSLALCMIAALPLPQTPALIFFGITRHDYLSVFIAIFLGKAIKYGFCGWLVARSPERFSLWLNLGWRESLRTWRRDQKTPGHVD